jgi:TonB family protein
MEKRAVANTQQILAQDLDPELPRLPFATWFKQLAGPGAGIVWQLSECGDATSPATGEIQACVEANTILPDGRRIILMLEVGTFKRGVTGAPAFQFGVIERGSELRTIRRLRDLQKQLLAPRGLENRPAVKLPEISAPQVELSVNNAPVDLAPVWGGDPFDQSIEEPPPGPPPAGPVMSEATLGMENAAGPVNVEITISETGRVIEAKATSGHPLLRSAAVEAAREWAFKPAILNGSPVKTETVLVFVFTVPK